MPPAKLGLVYSHTGLRRFLHAIGEPRTRELFLLGRNIDARTAQSWGLVNEVVGAEDLEDVALDWAEELAANAPLSVRGNKRVIRALLAAEGELDPDVERELIELREACFASEDMREGVRAFARSARRAGRGADGPVACRADERVVDRRPRRRGAWVTDFVNAAYHARPEERARRSATCASRTAS